MPDQTTTSHPRATWRRLVLIAVSLLLPGAGLVWLGRIGKGLAFFSSTLMLLYLPWIFPASRGNEILVGLLLLATAAAALGLLGWSLLLLWRESKTTRKPFAQRWHWPFWLMITVIFLASAVVPLSVQRPIKSFYFPSDSMAPTLQLSDKAWADMRNPGQFKRGDVVIHLRGTAEHVARIVALPGDRIALKGGIINLNGQPVPQKRISVDAMVIPTTPVRSAVRKSEQLPGALSHQVYDIGAMQQDDYPETRVPAGTVFLLGDNRDNALDSRFPSSEGGAGFLPIDQITGRIFLIYWSTDRNRIAQPVR